MNNFHTVSTPSMEEDIHLREMLVQRYSGSECSLYARAATALYVLFSSIREICGDGSVIVPSICCDVVALAAQYAGLKPVFADVDPSNFCISADWVQQNVQPDTRAIILAQVFGHAFDVAPFKDLGNDIVLIEDIAQSVGGSFRGTEVGNSCDFTLLSFADDKIIAGTGGALVHRTDQFDVAIAKFINTLPPPTRRDVLEQKWGSWRNFCHSLYDLHRADPTIDISPIFHSMIENYRDLIVQSCTVGDSATVIYHLNRTDEIQQVRYQRHQFYVDNIQQPVVEVVPIDPGAVPWRCCLLAQDQLSAFQLTQQLRNVRIPASNHYFSLAQLFEGTALPVADDVSARIVNLWVDDMITDDLIRFTVDVINNFRVS